MTTTNRVFHHSPRLYVAEITDKAILNAKGIPMYLIADLRPCGKITVGSWTEAWNAIQIEEEMVG